MMLLLLLYLPGKIHFIEGAGDFLSINNWQGSPAPWAGILGCWCKETEFHLELVSENDGDTNTCPSSPHSHCPRAHDEDLAVVTFIRVIFLIVPLAA